MAKGFRELEGSADKCSKFFFVYIREGTDVFVFFTQDEVDDNYEEEAEVVDEFDSDFNEDVSITWFCSMICISYA